MKLQCEIEVIGRECSNLMGISTKRRPVKSTLALGKEPKNDKSYFILHFSSLNKVGTRYKVNENIQQVFTKFCHEGKATIRFVTPPNDLCIKNCDPNQLKLFLKALKLVLDGNADGLKLVNLSNISATSIKPPQTKLCITDASQYPIKGLPRTLEQLEILEINMHIFRREILSLKSLKCLNLKGNMLQKLPKELGTLPNLVNLNLSHNRLGYAEELDWRWLEGPQICTKLSQLDLSSNNLGPHLPCTISKLKRLTTLHLEDNSIARLPHGLSKLDSLRYLYLSRNKLTSFPGAMRTLRLEELDVSGNTNDENPTQENNHGNMVFRVGTLVETAGATVLNNNIHYAKGMIPLTLVHYLNSSKFCICGRATFNTRNFQIIKKSLKHLFRYVVFDSLTESMNLECNFCSYKCFRDRSTFFSSIA